MGSARLIANEAQQLARAAGSNVVTQADIGNAMQVELPKTIGLRTTELAIGHYVLEPGGSIVSLLLGDSNYNQHCVLVRFPRGAGSSPVLGGKCTG
jgi:hypothetical protein